MESTERKAFHKKQSFSGLRRKKTVLKQSFSGLRKRRKTILGLRFAISLSKKAEKYSTSKGISTRKNDIHNIFKKPMTEELRTLIAGEVYNQCYGCQVDHPSQRQHELCLIKTRQEHTDMFIEKFMMELNPYKIMETWYPELIQMKPVQNHGNVVS